MTGDGGANGDGTVFSLNAAGQTFTLGGCRGGGRLGPDGDFLRRRLTGATETIANDQSGDSLHFTSQNGITGSFNAGTGVLTLSGSATPAQYQTALQSVTFSTTSFNTTTRTIDVVALDSGDTGNVPSNTGVDTVAVSIAAPTVTASGSTGQTLTVGSLAVAVDSGLAVASADTDLTGATETITNYQSGDSLNFTNQNGISGSYSGGVLTLTGSATPAQYQAALRSVTFSTTSGNATTRTIDVVALDSSDTGDEPSNTAVDTVVLAIAPPVVTPSDFQTLAALNGANGEGTEGGLVLSGSTLYGAAAYEGANGDGDIFSVPVAGGTPTVLASFNGTDGANPNGNLTLIGSTLYGMTEYGGTNNQGAIFSIPVTGGTPTVLASFGGTSGELPQASLTLSADGTTLYGTTLDGGADGDGTIFSIPVTGGTPTILFSFNGTSGANPYGDLTVSGSTLYGTTKNGGANGDGTIFSIPATGGTPTTLLSFSGANGQYPEGSLTLGGSTLYGMTYQGGASSDGTIFSISTSGSRFKTLASFNGTDGANPFADLTLSGSTLFGTTLLGGAYADGTVFRIPVTGGTPTTLVTFNGANGARPTYSLTLSGSTLYGAAESGGANGDGTLFAANAFAVGHSGDTGQTYTLGGAAVAVDSGVTVSSYDTDLTGATLTIANFQSGDSLNFTSQNGITGSYSSGTGVLTLTGSATPAQYTAALQSVTFSTTSINTTARTIDVVALDSGDAGNVNSNTAVESALVAIPAPVVTPSGTTSTFKVGGTAVAVDAGLSATSYDMDLSGATETITNDQAGDTLNFTSQNGITGTFNSATGVLTLVGSATPAHYQAALQSVTFSTTSTAGTSRTVSIVTADGALDSSPAAEQVNVDFTTLKASGATSNFYIGSTGATVDANVTLNASDTDLTGATVTITNNQSGDSLNFTSASGITGSYNSTTGVLSLSGSATVAEYQTALQSVTFSTTSTSLTNRSLSIVALDANDSLNSSPVAEQVNVAIATVTPSGAANTFLTFGSPVAVDSGVTVTSYEDLTGATMTIANDQSGDTLIFTNQFGISGSYNSASGVLTLTGSTTAAAYQLALQSVTFSTTNTSAGTNVTRSLSVVVSVGALNSPAAAESVPVTFAQVTPSDTTNTFVAGGSPVPVDLGVTVTSLQVDILTGATVTITNYQPGDMLNYTEIDGIVGSYSGGTLTLTNDSSVGDYQAALASITFSTTSANTTPRLLLIDVTGDVTTTDADTAPGPLSFEATGDAGAADADTALRSLSLGATSDDGGDTVQSATATETVNVVPAAPVVTTSGSNNVIYDIGYPPVQVDSAVTVTSTDTDGDISGATMTDTGYKAGDTFNFTSQNGITGSYSNGTLTLTGSATPAQYTAALQSVKFSTTYVPTGGLPTAASRTVDVVADDNSASPTSSNTGTDNVQVAIAAPVVAANQVSVDATAGQRVTVDSPVTVSSYDTALTGATMTIGTGYQSGLDTLSFINQQGITGTYNGGVLTLVGNATPAQYQAALAAVTFSSKSTSTATRNISIVVSDSGATNNPNSLTATTQIAVSPPVTVAAVWVENENPNGTQGWGKAGTQNFLGYLQSHSLGSSAYGYALQTGTSQSNVLPWANINTVTVEFSGQVSDVGMSSLVLTGGASGSTPSVTGFSSLGNNTYSWTLSSALASNQYLLAIATTGSAFGTPGSTQVTDLDGAPISGAFTTSSSTFPSGNGLAGGSFNFLFNVLPGDGSQGGTVSTDDVSEAGTLLGYNEKTSAGYNPYYDYYGAGIITSSDSSLDTQNLGQTVPSTPPAAPSIIVTASGNPASYTAGASAVDVDPEIAVSSDMNLTGATVNISSGTLQSGDLLNFANTTYPDGGTITGSYNSSTGLLSLAGSATPADYQLALQSVTFSSTSTADTSRTLSIVAADGALDSGAVAESVNVTVSATPPSVTAGGVTSTFSVGGSPVAVDSGVKVVTGTDADINEATMVLTNPVSGDTLNFTNTLGITGSYSSGTLTLTGNASVASYQTALQSVTFSSSNTSTPSTTPRLVTVQADDSAASPTTSDTITDTVDVTIPAPTVTSGGTPALYTAGGNAVTVDGGIKVNSDDTSHMTGATLVISTNEQSGDTLNFNNSNTLGITGSYSSGTLTLSGTASSANYQTALQSVTFNSSSTVTAARSITVQVDDTNASPTSSSTIADTVDVYAPAKVTALYVKGTAWVAGTFESYLGSHTLGNSATPTLGYALQTGANQSKDLPWLNINVIEATFSEQVNVSQSSLVLSGFSSTAYTYPSVTGFSSLGGNTYAWTLSTSLTKNRLEISFLSTGAHAVTDVNGVDGSGAGLSGNWSNGTSSFPSGNGLAGTTSGPNTPTSSDFNFLFNALPGDSARNGTIVNSTDYIDVKNKVNNTTASSNYTPYYDVLGVGAINSTSYIDVKNRVNNSQTPSSNAPGPQDSGVGGLTTTGDDADLTGAMLAVQEGSTGQTGGGAAPAASNQTSGGTSSTSSSTGSSSSGSSSSSSSTGSLASDTDATDAAVSDFDLADLYV